MTSQIAEVLSLAAQEQFNTLPARLNEVEKSVHTLQHRMDKLEDEKLPSRVEKMETVVAQVRGDVSEMKEISRDVGSQLRSGIAELKGAQERQQAFFKGALIIGAALFALIKFAPAISFVIKQLAK